NLDQRFGKTCKRVRNRCESTHNQTLLILLIGSVASAMFAALTYRHKIVTPRDGYAKQYRVRFCGVVRTRLWCYLITSLGKCVLTRLGCLADALAVSQLHDVFCVLSVCVLHVPGICMGFATRDL